MATIIGHIIRVILSIAIANRAEEKGKSFGGYAALSFFVSPIVGYIFSSSLVIENFFYCLVNSIK